MYIYIYIYISYPNKRLMNVRNNQNRGLEMFRILSKYKTRQQREKVPTANVDYLVSKNTPPHNSVQHIYDERDILITFHR